MSQSGQYYSGNERRGSGARPQFGDMTVGDYANGMPSIRVGEMIKSLLRQLVWFIPLMLIGVVAAVYATKDIKRSYKGEGSILVQLGDEYVYDPVTGRSSQGGGLMLTPDIITLNESAIMKSQGVIQAVKTQIESNNLQQHFAPKIYAEIAAASNDPVRSTKAQLKLHDFIEKSFSVEPQPKSFIVDLSFKHENGPIAVEVTRYFMNAYMKQRQNVFVEGSAEAISDRRKATEEQIRANEDAIQAFLKKNGISDFTAERTGATTRLENLRAQLNTLRAEIAQSEAALSSVEAQLREEPKTIDLYNDDRAGQRLAQAELELKNLLARYLPNSDPVRAKQAEIAQIRELQASRAGAPIGGRRVGPNPVYQALMTRRNLLQSTADSQREREFAVQRQLNAANAKVKLLQRLSPDYQALLREQATLNQRHTGYTAKEQEALINQRQAEASSENVKIISWPELPRKGRNMRAILALLIILGWGFTLFMVALLRVFLDPKLYGSRPQFSRRSADNQGYNSSYSGGDRRASRPSFTPDAYVPESVPEPEPTPGSTIPRSMSSGSSEVTLYESVSVPPSYMPVPYEADANPTPSPTASGTVPVLGTVPTNEGA